MSEPNFVQVGYKQGANYIPGAFRARDVFASNGVTAEAHIGNSGIHLTPEQATLIAGAIQSALLGAAGGVATLGADGHIPAAQLDLGKYQTSANVATYEDMLALDTTVKNGCPVGGFVFVADATGDATVKSGWASYKRTASNGNASDYVKVAEGESLDISFPDLEQGIVDAKADAATAQTAADAAQGTANTAVTNAATAQTAAEAAQGTADTAVTNAATADGKAVAAQGTADTAVANAATAQAAAEAAATEAAKLDFAYCTSEADMASKNLREGAMVLMAVSNDPA